MKIRQLTKPFAQFVFILENGDFSEIADKANNEAKPIYLTLFWEIKCVTFQKIFQDSEVFSIFSPKKKCFFRATRPNKI